MSVAKRKTPTGYTAEYHYRFKIGGQLYYGVCHNCTTERAAELYERNIRETIKKASEQRSVRALVENFRDELTGGKPIGLTEAYDLYLLKPTKRKPGAHQIACNQSYWRDFTAFMAANYPDVEHLANVTKHHAEEYISLLRTSGAFDRAIKYSRNGKEYSYTPENIQLSPRTINARHKAIKAVFSRLGDDAGLLANPFELPTLDNATVSRDAFTDAELQRIGENMTMPYTRPVFTIGLCTGLTLGDICLLRWDEISGNWITNKRRRKTGTKLEIPILPPLAAFLQEQRPITGAGEYVCPELAEMYLNNQTGVMYRIREFLNSIQIKTSVKVEGRSRAISTKAAHAMRHTFAYLAGVYSIPQPIVQGVLGHLSPEMTALYQKHAQREQKERFFRQMPNVLGAAAPAAIAADSVAMIAADAEPEREELHRLIDAADIETVREILQHLKSGSK